MRSFEFAKKTVRDTKVPDVFIPLIILHWWKEYYYGGHLTPLDMRKFLKPKLHNKLYPLDVVTTWIKDAERWRFFQEEIDPGSVDRFLKQYNQLQLVA